RRRSDRVQKPANERRLLKECEHGELTAINSITSSGQALQTSNWVIATEANTGVPIATITVSASVRSMTVTVKMDAATQETVIACSASDSTPGLSDASWSSRSQ